MHFARIFLAHTDRAVLYLCEPQPDRRCWSDDETERKEKTMKKELLLGAAYYLEYMPYDRLETDLKLMKEAGFNVIRIAESTWSTWEPEDNVFDFTLLDRMLDGTEKYGLQVIVGTPTYAIPAWLVKKHPQVLAETKKGRGMYGPRQIMDITDSVFRFHAERIIRKVMERTADRSCVIGFQIDNETKHYGTASAQVQKAFVDYLKEKFKTTDNLNKAFNLAYWSNAVHSWEDFPDVRGTINGGLAGEFEKFQRKLAVDYLYWQADLVKEYKREDQFITHNMDFEWVPADPRDPFSGHSYGVQPDINHYAISKCLTLAGTDIYHPTQDFLTGAEIAFGGDSIRSLKQDNYLVSECQAQGFKQWTPYPGQLKLHAYSHLASGALGIMYWNWHSIHNGFEVYWKGVLSHDLQPGVVYEEIRDFGKQWQAIGSHLLGMKKKNKVALVTDNVSLTGLKIFPMNWDLTYNNVVRWMYDSLYEMNIECDVVDVNALDPDQYRMIVTPALYSATEETIRTLEQFVQKGGVLVSSFKSFMCNENLSVYPDSLPHGMTGCFGMSYDQFTAPGTAKVKGQDVTSFAELLKVDGGESLGNYEHPYWGKYAAMTKNTCGEGKAYYMGCFTSKDVLKELYRQAAKDAGIEIPSLSWPLISRKGSFEDGRWVDFLLNYSPKEQTVDCPYNEATNLLDGKTYKKGEKILLKDWGVAVLER